MCVALSQAEGKVLIVLSRLVSGLELLAGAGLALEIVFIIQSGLSPYTPPHWLSNLRKIVTVVVVF